MSQMPGAVIVVDVRKEYIALREAHKLGIPTIGIIDTDSDPDTDDIDIPANDDSIRAVSIILGELADAVSVGKTVAPKQPMNARPARRARTSRRTLVTADDSKPQPAEPAAAEAPAVPVVEAPATDAPKQAPAEEPAQTNE